MEDFSVAVSVSKAFIESLETSREQLLDSLKAYFMGVLREDPEPILALAERDAVIFNTVCLLIGDSIKKNESLAPQVQEWLVRYLRRELREPTPAAGQPPKAASSLRVAIAVANCVQKGMTATRNDVSPPNSACDAVAEAMFQLGRTPATYEGVKRIWLRNKRRIAVLQD